MVPLQQFEGVFPEMCAQFRRMKEEAKKRKKGECEGVSVEVCVGEVYVLYVFLYTLERTHT